MPPSAPIIHLFWKLSIFGKISAGDSGFLTFPLKIELRVKNVNFLGGIFEIKHKRELDGGHPLYLSLISQVGLN